MYKGYIVHETIKRVAGLLMFLLHIWLLRICNVQKTGTANIIQLNIYVSKTLLPIADLNYHCCNKKLKLKLSTCILNHVLFSVFYVSWINPFS